MKTENILLNQIIIIAVGIVLFVALFFIADKNSLSQEFKKDIINFEEIIIAKEGVVLPIQWNDLGRQMVEAGVIDKVNFEKLYENRGGLSDIDKKILYGIDNKEIIMNTENSGFLLNLLWAFGLSNKNRILEEGPMTQKKYGGNAGNFASTGGWNLSVGDSMNHYSKYQFIELTEEQQALVERVSKNIYRPCCGNSTYFPDCNHGMAMLGLLELLAMSNISEEEMYEIALKVNSYWFPDTYLAIAQYFSEQGIEWKDVNPKEVLSDAYSSAQGYMRVLEEIQPIKTRSAGGCSV